MENNENKVQEQPQVVAQNNENGKKNTNGKKYVKFGVCALATVGAAYLIYDAGKKGSESLVAKAGECVASGTKKVGNAVMGLFSKKEETKEETCNDEQVEVEEEVREEQPQQKRWENPRNNGSWKGQRNNNVKFN